MTDRLRIGLVSGINAYSGWGVVMLNIALELSARADIDLHLWGADLQGVNPLDVAKLEPIIERGKADYHTVLARQRPIDFDGVLIHVDGNAFEGINPGLMVRSERNVCLMVFEDTAMPVEGIERLRAFTHIVTASRWNHELLLNAGLPNVLIPQGIDPTIFHPAPKSGRWRDRFVVFSGGKLEYRKGQDIVLAAFREFRKQHPEALLVTAWQNRWPQLAIDMTLNGHIEHEPIVTAEGVDIEGWFTDNGLPEGSAFDIGMVPNGLMGQVMREADVAVFMSRAEGGTNLMAMEAIASGVPTIVSANTGHRDIMGALSLYSLDHSRPPTRFFTDVEGWGEVAPTMLASSLEARYRAWGDGTWVPQPTIPTWRQHTDSLARLLRGES